MVVKKTVEFVTDGFFSKLGLQVGIDLNERHDQMRHMLFRNQYQ